METEPFRHWPRKDSAIHSFSGLTGIGGRRVMLALEEEVVRPVTGQRSSETPNKAPIDVLETRPLRFLVVALSMRQGTLSKDIIPLARTISIKIRSGTEITSNPDFGPNGLRRIVVCLDHLWNLF